MILISRLQTEKYDSLRCCLVLCEGRCLSEPTLQHFHLAPEPRTPQLPSNKYNWIITNSFDHNHRRYFTEAKSSAFKLDVSPDARGFAPDNRTLGIRSLISIFSPGWTSDFWLAPLLCSTSLIGLHLVSSASRLPGTRLHPAPSSSSSVQT
ncbi:hypothetical protein JAAARDRAFT_490978 [Jaapia argillacea MUCL 33604]|uniref:Uncharacterized protein n=1 Tax=Jaapia argillacea MUCL 33604 TaxID=933084 RepID=A0A067PB64_9AGAM|nr:hypothetical protein JAAARDRAFT_490978 [Jaapia argillacea MUCL 33604]